MEPLDKDTDGSSLNIVESNIGQLKAMFPDTVSEGKIDFDKLREALGDSVETQEERYNFSWNGKALAKRIAQTKSTGTLRPDKDESKHWDTTQNLFIEGDNLEVLKLLQKSYHKQVKMIYIDPPYNTGNEFIYPDNFQDNLDTYLQYTHQKDDEGRKFGTNPDTSGRYHTNWLNMMYPRLKLARNLLQDDGVIFISIGDEELHNLRKIGDEIFGEDNYRGTISRATGTRMGSGNSKISSELDFIVIYAKTNLFEFYGLPMSISDLSIYNQEDEKGKYLTRSLRRTGGENRREDRPTMFYPVQAPDGGIVYPIAPEGWESRWICGKEKYEELLRTGIIEWRQVKKDGEVRWQVYQKHYIGEALKYASNLWVDVEGNKKASRDLKVIFGEVKLFDFPKPIELLKRIVSITCHKNELILDFFSGSCTTAHAVMDLNVQDNGNRKFIMVQLPEPCDEKTEAYKAGYKTIADIGKERIRRAGEKILQDNTTKDGIDNLDIGFKVFKLDSSNIKAWDADFDNLENTLLNIVDNIKEDRSEDDVLTEILLKYGLDLTVPIEERQVSGKTVYIIGFGALVVCLADAITLEVVEGIGHLKAELAPEVMRVVFKDSGFKDDVVKTNAIQILKQYGIDDVKSL